MTEKDIFSLDDVLISLEIVDCFVKENIRSFNRSQFVGVLSHISDVKFVITEVFKDE